MKLYKHFSKVALILCAIFLFSQNTLADAGINQQLTYYGVLKNVNGTIVADGNYDMVFKIYTVDSGGTALWTGNYTAANGNPVAVADGNFVVMLGSGAGNTLNIDFSQDTYYVGLTVGTDAEMTPRQRLGASAYSFNSDMVDGTHIFKVAGDPNGTQNGSVGDMAIDTTTGTLDVKSSGVNTNTGWTKMVGTDDTETLTNKRIALRVGSTTSSATPTIDTDNVDEYDITALAVPITSMTTNLSGTPVEGDQLTIKIKDNGTAQTIAWGASFANGIATLPTTTTAGKNLWTGFTWSSSANAWKCQFTGSEQ
jgi:hypothetical protein